MIARPRRRSGGALLSSFVVTPTPAFVVGILLTLHLLDVTQAFSPTPQLPNQARLSIEPLRGGYHNDVVNDKLPIQFFTLASGLCPYAARTHITLLELELDFERIEIAGGAEKPDWYLRINPRGKVPALRNPADDNVVLYESAICNEYLCDFVDFQQQRGVDLFPSTPSMRAKMRLLQDHYDTNVGKTQFTYLMNKDDSEKDAQLQQQLEEGLQVYEDALEESGGPFLMGSTFTLADVHIVPFITRLIVSLKHYKGYELPVGKFRRLLAWYDACLARPSVNLATPADKLIIEAYQKFLQVDYSFGGLNTNK